MVRKAHAVEGLVDGGRPLHAARGGDVDADVHLSQARNYVLVPERRALLPSNPVLSMLELHEPIHGAKAAIPHCKQACQRRVLVLCSLHHELACIRSRQQQPRPHLNQQPVLCRAGKQHQLTSDRRAWACGPETRESVRHTDYRRSKNRTQPAALVHAGAGQHDISHASHNYAPAAQSADTCRRRQREHAGGLGERLRERGLRGAAPRHRRPGVQPVADVGGGLRPPRAGHLHCAACTAWSLNIRQRCLNPHHLTVWAPPAVLCPTPLCGCVCSCLPSKTYS